MENPYYNHTKATSNRAHSQIYLRSALLEAFEGDSFGTSPCIKVVKEERHIFDGDTEVVEMYALRDDTLKMVGITKQKYY